MPAGIFGINDDTVNLVVNLLVAFLVVLWLALVAWTFFDARRRIEDPVLVVLGAAAAFIFPFVGALVYSILRPPELLGEKHERELEIRASELRVRQLEEQSCPNCEHPVERTYLRCPNCRARIKHPCPSCEEAVDPRWSLCPYCETALRRAAPSERKAKRRPEAPERGAERKGREREPEKSRDRRSEKSRKRSPQPAGTAPADGGRSSESGRKERSGEEGSKDRSGDRSKTRSGDRSKEPSADRSKERSGRSSSRRTSSKQRG